MTREPADELLSKESPAKWPTKFCILATFIRKPRCWRFLCAVDLTSYHEFRFGKEPASVQFSELLEPWRLQI